MAQQTGMGHNWLNTFEVTDHIKVNILILKVYPDTNECL